MGSERELLGGLAEGGVGWASQGGWRAVRSAVWVAEGTPVSEGASSPCPPRPSPTPRHEAVMGPWQVRPGCAPPGSRRRERASSGSGSSRAWRQPHDGEGRSPGVSENEAKNGDTSPCPTSFQTLKTRAPPGQPSLAPSPPRSPPQGRQLRGSLGTGRGHTRTTSSPPSLCGSKWS